ncbi:YkoP family protein [Robertmurraya kyonggiensis]|uniref:YkoP-like domain-containing protein n=1 Tax=Robertmurraya kyonggiensis TaxID=1037680 RepID=A0A4U1D0U0_9BACI|nr:hypothetical protein [Robertmurraya kyonggiensis]TKC15822.1 hypothetical protein FA727_17040 [Robertmurraya kyonggiensis]
MRDYFISIWELINPIYYHCTRLTYLSSHDGNIFRVRLTKYKGRNIVLSDGINKNDTLVKIHLHNVRLLKEFKNINSEIRKAKIIYNYVKKSLPEIDLYIQIHIDNTNIKGIIGITTLNKGCERLGFEVFDISHPIYKWFKRSHSYQLGFYPVKISLYKVYLNTHKPSYLLVSTRKLTNMYKH